MAAVTEITWKGLPALKLANGSGASCTITPYGAHLVQWTDASGKELLFVSSIAEGGGGKAIRGGVPICWPQFAAKGPYAKHGFCRNSAEWTVVRTSTEPYPCVVLGLVDSATSKAQFPSPFALRYSVTLDSEASVSTSLTVMNTSPDQPLEFTTALHT